MLGRKPGKLAVHARDNVIVYRGGSAAKLHAPDMLEQRGLNGSSYHGLQWKGGVPDEILDAVFRACDTDDDGALCPRHQCP